MKARTLAACATVAALAGLAGCAGGKPADSPGGCPKDTVQKGDDCLPSDDKGGTAKKDEDSWSGPSSGGSKSDDGPSASGSSGGGSGSSGGGGDTSSSSGSSGKAPYDKEAVDTQLKVAARQIKGNCGAATDENGTAGGPWGKLTAQITLGRNGHVKTVTVPPEYDGKPVGTCIVHAFQKLVFPPYAASTESTVPYDIEVTKPKK
jgi:hypothetical protein